MPQTATVQTIASYLTTGYWRDTGNIPHSFDTSSSNVITVNLTGLTSSAQTLAKAALDAWETVADIDFKLTAGSAQIVIDDKASGAVTNVRMQSNGDITSASVNVSTAWLGNNGTTIGSYSFQTFLHEIGHALGLGHSSPAQTNDNFARDAKFSNDSWQTTVMSYFDQDENNLVNATKAVAVTPMMADIIAIQSLYGAPTGGPTAGNTIYGVGADSGTYVDAIFRGQTGSLSRNALTIYDEGGVDTINVSNDTRVQNVNLNGGAFSNVYGLVGNLGIAVGTTIENLSAGSANDKVIGNAAANRISGNAGGDFIDGAAGNDALYGGEGNDSVYGGGGNDRLQGDNGNDAMNGQAGDDLLYGGAGNDMMSGFDGRDLVEGGDGNDNLAGGQGNDTLRGGNNTDRLDGGMGNDTLAGNGGNDSFVFSGGRDVVVDFSNNADTLILDNALWGNRLLTPDQVLDLGRVSNGAMVFDFGGGNTLTLNGVTNEDWLLDDMAFI